MPLSPRTLAAVMRQETEDTDIVLITLTHPKWTEPVRVSTHPTVFLRTDEMTGAPIYGTRSRGLEFLFLPVTAMLPNTADEQPPEARLTISNASRALVPYMKAVDREYPRVTLEIVNSSTPDVVDSVWPEMDLGTVSWDASTVDASVTNDIASSEPIPWMRFNKSNFPNMQEN